ncbi:MAG: hypothetical protein ACRD0O_06430, partial [Acidimicrobiia bacterium]
SRRLLLVLDNCEHLLDAVAVLAEAVVERCPDVTVLTTSREPLGLPAEQVWRVPPLSLPDAVALLGERAQAAEPGFRVDAANADALGRIARRLDGLPLALELAAARLRPSAPAPSTWRRPRRWPPMTAPRRPPPAPGTSPPPTCSI